jgi:hypothetical protein
MITVMCTTIEFPSLTPVVQVETTGFNLRKIRADSLDFVINLPPGSGSGAETLIIAELVQSIPFVTYCMFHTGSARYFYVSIDL